MTDPKAGNSVKHSYTIACASAFRDAVEALAARRRVNVGDIARSVLLVVPAETIAGFPDPGDPDPLDRETVVLKSGPSQGRPWRRKPRLQVRMAPGFDALFIRRALALALAMDQGALALKLEDPSAPPPIPEPPPPPPPPPPPVVDTRILDAVNEEVERLRAIVNVLSFEPLPHGVSSKADALHVLGFPPGTHPDKRMVRARFRMLATIHHPDSNYGSHDRMSQLNQAMEYLKD
ncbi:J domain-containing protein [Magnetospirillum moscoviense]|uniref:Molecular chaperone DnaJ n=1 Tax=Magnetospirillum moscoviense TaxID=1437059 RepID=A0A178MYH7_9PROT|nr:J domain-containing protein [Magnetospirillum moscoviense]MBF0324760.1 J domain-containing protein [Alphaproteobacteria bacterium]OAN56886.1 molecular chaperone DnaJ [Magnetospirillum moscoviense]